MGLGKIGERGPAASLREADAPTAKLKVFISYSRADTGFADELVAGLDYDGSFDVTMDSHAIHEGEDWQERLGALIADADTVVFILTPRSSASTVCKWEVEEAERLSKRILPVQAAALDGIAPPPQLARLNYVRFDESRSFMAGLAGLRRALKSDLVWLREHTRLLVRAREWDSANRAENRLLSGPDVAAAKTWLSTKPPDAPPPIELHYDFIAASEQAETARLSAERQRAEELQRAVKRTRAALVGALAFLMVAASAAGYGYLKQKEAVEAAKVAEEQRSAAKEALARTFADRSWIAIQDGRTDLAIKYAIAGWRSSKSSQAHFLPPLRKAMYGAVKVATIKVQDARINAAALSPDGTLIAVVGETGASIVRVADLQVQAKLDHGAVPVTNVSFDASGATVVTVSADGTLRTWVTMTGALQMKFSGYTEDITSAVFSPDGRRIVTASRDKTARLWDGASGQEIARFLGHEAGLSTASFSPDGLRILTGSSDGTARLWDGNTGQQLYTFPLKGEVHASSFSADGRLLAIGAGNAVYLVELGDGALTELGTHQTSIRGLSLSVSGDKLSVVDEFSNVYVWSLPKRLIVAARYSDFVADDCLSNSVGLATFNGTGDLVAIDDCNQTDNIVLWDAAAARSFAELYGLVSYATVLLWGNDALYVGDAQGNLYAFDLRIALRPLSVLVKDACNAQLAPNAHFTTEETHQDPIIKEVWDPVGTAKSLCD